MKIIILYLKTREENIMHVLYTYTYYNMDNTVNIKCCTVDDTVVPGGIVFSVFDSKSY